MNKNTFPSHLVLVLLAVLIAVPSAMAYDFEEGGIYYNDCGNDQVQVTFKDETYNSYSGRVNIPSTITHDGKNYTVCGIKSYAFYRCAELTSVTVPTTVTTIGDHAFAYCRALTSAVIGRIDYSPYYIDDIVGTWVSEYGADSYGTYDIMGNDVVRFDFYNNYTGRYTFYTVNGPAYIDISWETQEIRLNINYSDGDHEALYYGFYQDGYLILGMDRNFSVYTAYRSTDSTGRLRTNPTDRDMTSIGDQAFHECENLTDLRIGNNVASIGEYAFYRCMSLKELNIPNSVETIGVCAFLHCQGLTRVVIGSGVRSIGYGAFGGAWQLTAITCHAVMPPTFQIDTNYANFNPNVYDEATLFVPGESISQYRRADVWKEFSNIKAIRDRIPGDVNNDGEVNIADVNAVIDAILSNSHDLDCDVNEDNEVNIADVNAVIDIILK